MKISGIYLTRSVTLTRTKDKDKVNINYLTYLLTSNTYKIESKLFIYLVRVICFSCIGYT